MTLGWHKKRAAWNRAWPQHPTKRPVREVAQPAPAPPLHFVPGDCPFCGNECDLNPGDHWWCMFCGTLYEGT